MEFFTDLDCPEKSIIKSTVESLSKLIKVNWPDLIANHPHQECKINIANIYCHNEVFF